MKLNKIFSAFVLSLALFNFASCEKPPIDDGPTPGKDDDTAAVVTDATKATVAEAIAKIEEMADGAESTEYYEIAGIVTNVSTSASDMLSYKNLNFTLTDETGSIASWYTNYLDNKPFDTADKMLNVGDTVVVIAHLKKYVKNSKMTPELVNGYLKSLSRNNYEAQILDKSFAEAVAIGKGQSQDVLTLDYYRIKGVVSSVKTGKDALVQYGNCIFNIADPTGASSDAIICYYTNWLDNQPFTSADDIPCKGDTVIVVGPLTNYSNDAELKNGYIESITRVVLPPVVPDDETGLDVPQGAISCAEAIAIGKQLADQAATDATYFIKGIVMNVETDQSGVDKYGNVIFDMADDVNDTVRFKAYCVYGKDSATILDVKQVVPGNVVVIKSQITNYKGTIETVQNKGYIYSTTNTFVPEVTPIDPSLVSWDITFASEIPYGWKAIGGAEFYGNGGLKLNREGKGIQSPTFAAATSVPVEFTIGAFNVKTSGEGVNGTDGPNFQVIGLSATGAVVDTEDVVTPEAKAYSVTLEGEGIAQVKLVMVSFPYNGSKYCNVNLSKIKLTLPE